MASYLIAPQCYGVLILIGVNLAHLLPVLHRQHARRHGAAEHRRQARHAGGDREVEGRARLRQAAVLERQGAGSEQLTETIFWERSVSLFALRLRPRRQRKAGDIGTRSPRAWGEPAAALPTVRAQVCSWRPSRCCWCSSAHSRWTSGAWCCAWMLSISEPVLHHRRPVPVLARAGKLVPISGYAPGLDAVQVPGAAGAHVADRRHRRRGALYRAMFLEEIGKDYVRTARAKGLAEQVVLFRHVLRNALIPIITSAGGYLPYVFLGSLVFESFFGIPGLGAYVIEAIGKQDFAIVRTMVFLGSVLYIASYILIDMAYTWVDPRVRLA
jgi:peptide/nickel transport system permease protein